MLLLHEKYPQVTDPAELLPLAFQVLRFKMSAAVRKAVRRGEHSAVPVDELPLPSQGEDPERAAARAELKRQLLSAIAHLGDRCRDIFRLKLLGRNFEEIRVHFAVDSINTIYTWDSRCRKSLLERLGGHWEKGR